MKPILPILLSLLLSTSAFCQSAVDSFFNIKTQKPPENWVELIQNGNWIYHCEAYLINGKLDTVINYGEDFILKFDSSTITMGRLYHDPIYHPVIYSPSHNRFTYRDIFNYRYRVINVTDLYLSIERTNPKDIYYEYQAKGKVNQKIYIYKKSQP